MNTLPLTRIGFFNPGRLNDQEIEQSFIARIPLFQFIFNKIIAEDPDSIPQHHLIIGQRGMGKTALLLRIGVELRKKPYSDHWIALNFPEEQYNVDRLSKFWLNCLDALADALEKENNTEAVKKLDYEIQNLSKKNNDTEGFLLFENWIKALNRRPVLLLDNLNLIFDKISKEQKHQLRSLLIVKNAPIIIGASANTIDETVDYSAAFYDAFQTHYLKKLSFDESIEVLKNLAKITGKAEFEHTIQEHLGRLNALYQLTGGTPRTIAMLFPLIQDGFSTNIQSDLDSLLDMVTPLYKAKFEELPDQLQVILDATALYWDPITIESLRDLTLLTNANLSPQLKRLIDIGWLSKIESTKSKGSAYEIVERFFNIWYLMRRSSRRQKKELYCLGRFLESFYGQEALEKIAKKRLNSISIDQKAISLDLAISDRLQNNYLGARLKWKGYKSLLKTSKISKDIKKEFEDPEQEYLNRIKQNPEDAFAWNGLGNLYNFFERNEEAEKAYLKAIDLDPNDAYSWNNLGVLYSELQRNEEAERAYLKAIDLDPNDAYPLSNLGDFYKDLNRNEEAEKAYLKAINLDPKDLHPWCSLGFLYFIKKKNEEAEKAYLKAIDLDAINLFPWIGLGLLYFNCKRYKEAEKAYLKAIEFDPRVGLVWCSLGILYSETDRNEAAEKAYLKAIDLDSKEGLPWLGLGTLYGGLKRNEEAEKAYLKAIDLNPNNSNTWYRLGNLYNIVGISNKSNFAFNKAKELDPSLQVPLIPIGGGHNNTFVLEKIITAYLKDDLQDASKMIIQLLTTSELLYPGTEIGWNKLAGAVIKQGHAQHLLDLLSTQGYDIIWKPYFLAIKGLMEPNADAFLNNYAVEFREPTRKIMESIKNYM